MRLEANGIDEHRVMFLEQALKRSLEAEVEHYVKNMVQDKIELMVKEFAAEAVKNWSTSFYQEQDVMTNETRVRVQFIEKIIKTVAVPNDIKIEVMK